MNAARTVLRVPVLRYVAAAAFILAVLPAPAAHADGLTPQTLPGDVSVSDATGRTLPSVTVNGQTRLPRLPPGTYTVRDQTGGPVSTLTVTNPDQPPVVLAGTDDASTAALPVLAVGTAATAALLWLAWRTRGTRRGAAFAALASAAVLVTGVAVRLTTADTAATDAQIVAACTQESAAEAQRAGCIANRLLDDRATLKDAVRSLFTITSGDEPLWRTGFCHTSAHMLGEAAAKLGLPVNDATMIGDPSCEFGYHHGLLEAYGSYLPVDEATAVVIDVCTTIADTYRNPGYDRNCVHGIGHTYMSATNLNLTESAALCRALPPIGTAGDPYEECYAGALMDWAANTELAARLDQPERAPQPRVELPLTLCEEPLGTPSTACVGTATAATTDPELLGMQGRQWCTRHTSGDLLADCLFILAGQAASAGDVTAAADAAVQLCRTPGANPAACAQQAGRGALLAGGQERMEQLCDRFSEHQDACLRGAEAAAKIPLSGIGNASSTRP